MLRHTIVETVSFPKGEKTSAVFENSDHYHLGVVLPAEFSGSQLEFLVGGDRNTLYTLYDGAGGKVAITAASSQAFSLPDAVCDFKAVQLVADSANTATSVVATIVKKS